MRGTRAFLAAVACIALATTTATALRVHLAYAGNDRAILFDASSRTAFVHTVSRELRGRLCDLIVAPAVGQFSMEDDAVGALDNEDGVLWSYLGHDVVMEQDVASGQYVARRCNSESTRKPCPAFASGVDTTTTHHRRLFNAGPNRVLAYDAHTGAFQMLFFDNDVHGTGNLFHAAEGAIFEGSFPFQGVAQFAYLSVPTPNGPLELLAAFLPETGSLSVYEYNSGASSSGEAFGAVVGEGKVSHSNHASFVMQHLGGSDLVIYSPSTAHFEAWRFSLADTLEFAVVNRGNLTHLAPCTAKRTKHECGATPTCGWCPTDGGCHQMASDTHFCEGGYCKLPPPEGLSPSYRFPSLLRYEGDVEVVPSIAPYEREELLEPAFEEAPNVPAQNVLEWVSKQVQGMTPGSYFKPPPSSGEDCMNGKTNNTRLVPDEIADGSLMNAVDNATLLTVVQESRVKVPPSPAQLSLLRDNCTRSSSVLKRDRVMTANALQPAIAPSDKTNVDPSALHNTRDHMETMGEDYMNAVEGHAATQHLQPAAADNSPDFNMTMEMEDCLDKCEPSTMGTLRMRNAMNNAVGTSVDESGAVVPFPSSSPSESPSPLPPSPSESPSASPEPSITASPSPSPTARPFPCTEHALISDDVLTCGPCEAYAWTPDNMATHLARVHVDSPLCNDQDDGDMGIEELVQAGGADKEPERDPVTPDIEAAIIDASESAEPRPAVPAKAPPRSEREPVE